jgi:hypothetical protein
MRQNGNMSKRYVTASEVKSFAFCRRAWFLERQGAESVLVVERAHGRLDHENHVREVQQVDRWREITTWLFVLGLLGIAAAAILWWRAQ